MNRIIFASHGELSKGMKNSVSMIVGDLVNDVETYSLYPGENPNDFYEKLKAEVSTDERQVIILCDIKGGSVHTALMPLTIFPNVILISGMNMGLALDIVLRYRESLAEENFEELLESSREGITILNGIKEENDDEDF